MANDDVTIPELARLIERMDRTHAAAIEKLDRAQAARFRDMDTRLDTFVTHRTHDADLRTVDQRINSVDRDVTDVRRDVERAEVIARTSRQWAIGISVAAASVVIAALTFFQGPGAGGDATMDVVTWMVNHT